MIGELDLTILGLFTLTFAVRAVPVWNTVLDDRRLQHKEFMVFH